jgi:hypothetical protein
VYTPCFHRGVSLVYSVGCQCSSLGIVPKAETVGGTIAILCSVEAERKNLKDELKKKLERIEALYQRPGSVGEKTAAAIAMNRLKERIAVLETYARRQAAPRKYEFTVFKEI